LPGRPTPVRLAFAIKGFTIRSAEAFLRAKIPGAAIASGETGRIGTGVRTAELLGLAGLRRFGAGTATRHDAISKRRFSEPGGPARPRHGGTV
jgi:hypothetical protein